MVECEAYRDAADYIQEHQTELSRLFEKGQLLREQYDELMEESRLSEFQMQAYHEVAMWNQGYLPILMSLRERLALAGGDAALQEGVLSHLLSLLTQKHFTLAHCQTIQTHMKQWPQSLGKEEALANLYMVAKYLHNQQLTEGGVLLSYDDYLTEDQQAMIAKASIDCVRALRERLAVAASQESKAVLQRQIELMTSNPAYEESGKQVGAAFDRFRLLKDARRGCSSRRRPPGGSDGGAEEGDGK